MQVAERYLGQAVKRAVLGGSELMDLRVYDSDDFKLYRILSFFE